MSNNFRRMSSVKQIEDMCRQEISAEKIEQLRNRPEKSPTEKCKENHAVSEELKRQITELSHIRKSETVDARIQKIEAAIDTLTEQTKPLKKALNSALYSTDTELLELVALTTRETLLEIGGSAAIDPVEIGLKIGEALQKAHTAMKQYKPDQTEWCDEWMDDEDFDEVDELYNDMYKDSGKSESQRFATILGSFHRHNSELLLFSQGASGRTPDAFAEDYIEPSVYPINVDCDFILQLVDVERIEKQKKMREKLEKGSKKKETAELVKVNDKANNVQSEEVSISNELKHVLKVFKKELKNRQTEKIEYYEFITNPNSFSRTVENMFYISYLMRDREVFLVEEDGVPVLKKLTNPRDENEKKQWEKSNSTHGVTSLSFEEWKRLSKAFKKSIIEPLDG